MTVPRYLEKFESSSGALSVTFSRRLYEWESSQELRNALTSVAGMDYAFDDRRTAPSLLGLGQERVRFLLVGEAPQQVDSDLDSLRSLAWRIGLGKLWTRGADGSLRWAWARLSEMPSWSMTIENRLHLPVILGFVRESAWFAEDATTGTESAIVTSPFTFTITNPGNLPALFAVFRWRSNSAAGFTNPLLENLTNGYSIGSLRDAASTDYEVRIDTEALSLKYSTNNGSSYLDDYVNRAIGANQAKWMVLDPGANSMRLTSGGTPSYDFEYSFFASFA